MEMHGLELLSTMATDALVLEHQGISFQSADLKINHIGQVPN